MLLEFINDAKNYRDKYVDEYQESFDNPIDCEEFISKEMTTIQLENSEMLSKAKIARKNIIDEINFGIKKEIQSKAQT
jgi:hypothetical protein